MDRDPKALVSASFGSLSQLMDDIDDYCGTRPHRPFPPRPNGIRDALISVAIHTLASEISEGRVREQIQSLASNLYGASGKAIAG